MTGDEGVVAPEKNGGVAVVESLDFKDGGGWQIVKKNSAFDFGLDDGAVDVVG
jgi:hypothetical protein